MDKTHFHTIEKNASSHWWYQGRQRILSQILHSFPLPKNSQILEMGCATGENLEWLKDFGHLTGIEPDSWAVMKAKQKKIGHIYMGSLPNNMPNISETFDLVTLLDVLEHIDNDMLALKVLKKWLKPNGYMLITVPAYSFLWSSLDEINHHKRRYTRNQLHDCLTQNGYSVEYISYFNTFLFPLIYTFRLIDRFLGNSKHSDVNVSRVGNYILETIFSLEHRWIPQKIFYFGVSLAAVVKKK